MSKDRATIGTDGLPLPVLPPERDARVWARLVRVMFYLPGFMALLLLKTGEPESFGITVELLMLSSAAAIVGGLFVGSESSGAGADAASKVGTWSGSLVLELLAVVPFLHARIPESLDIALGPSEMLPAVAILPFMIYQLAGFGTLRFIVSKPVNWVINFGVLFLIVASYVANREEAYGVEKRLSSLLVICMAITVFYGVLRLRKMQEIYDQRSPKKAVKD
jgi:hypothetical protein